MNFIKRLFNRDDKYRKGIFIVVYRTSRKKPRYLIQKRKLHWKGFEFTKGGIEEGESRNKALLREVSEETGLSVIKVKNHHLSGRYPYLKGLKDRPGIIGQTWSLYSVEVGPGPVKLDKREHSGSQWLGYKSARDKLTWGNQKECLDVVDKWIGAKN
ncbi:MAG: NUDIX domain-containing protein [Nanoarchaeota archaeon]|jgi:8-oxo-dGTP pyrophosphatase MutT (NUDIX family)|nr:NUDIX domain-containing protein [Nanoarchaeota archaeon]